MSLKPVLIDFNGYTKRKYDLVRLSGLSSMPVSIGRDGQILVDFPLDLNMCDRYKTISRYHGLFSLGKITRGDIPAFYTDVSTNGSMIQRGSNVFEVIKGRTTLLENNDFIWLVPDQETLFKQGKITGFPFKFVYE